MDSGKCTRLANKKKVRKVFAKPWKILQCIGLLDDAEKSKNFCDTIKKRYGELTDKKDNENYLCNKKSLLKLCTFS